MNRDEFDGLIRKLEEFARARPGAYTVRVGLLAALGYAYLFAVLVFMLAGTVGLVALVIAFPNAGTLKLAIVLGAITGGISIAILRALWVQLPPPEGLELQRDAAPVLFGMIDDLRRRLRSPSFHRVLLTGDYNAAVVQIPRLGVFGWQRNYLILGLPLMQGLSPEQFRSVVAHEFGHLSRNHSRFSAWIYRVRRTWDQVFEQMARQRQRGAQVLVKFIRWYSPYFNAYSFVLARANEYQADRCAVESAGLPTAAQALIRTQVQGRLLSQSFWPDLYKRAALQPAPPEQAFTDVAVALRQGPNTDDARKWLMQAFQIRTSNADTHPCLKDRLTAMGYLSANDAAPAEQELPPQKGPSAAEHFFGSELERYRSELGRRWQAVIGLNWKQRFDQAQKLQQQLAELEQRAGRSDGPPPLPGVAWKRAQLVCDLQGDAAAEPLLREVLAAEPNHAGANFILGRCCLGRDEALGVDLIELAMRADPNAVQAGCDLLYGYYQRTGQHDKLRGLTARYDRHSEELRLAQHERANVTVNDSFLPHDLNAEQRENLRRQIQGYQQIAAAHLARKAVRYFADSPFYVLAVKPDAKWYQLQSSTANQELVRRLVKELKLPGQTLIFVTEKNLTSLGRKIAGVAGTEVFIRHRD